MANSSFSESKVVVHHNNQTLWPGVLLENISSSDDSLLNTSGDFGSDNFSEGSAFYRHSLPITIVYCLGYVIVFVLGLIGNCFVVAVVYRTPRMKTVTNYFIVNLAVADVLVVLFCLPATLLSNIFVPWVLGEVMCKLVAYVQGVSVVASVESLIAVSLDRVLAICFPMRFHITTRLARLMIVVIWFLAMTSTIPWPLFFNLVFIPLTVEETSNSHHIQNGGDKAAVCLETWPTEFADHVYFVVANLIFCYLLPLLLITICYVMIWLRVWRRSIPTDSKDPQMERIQQRSKVKVVKMLVIVVIIFSLSWLPLYAIFTRIKLGGEIEPWEEKVLAIATPIAQWLGSSNSCINPILYAFFNKKYRNGFKAIIKSRSCCGTLRIDENRRSTVSRTVTYPLHKIAVRYAPESKSVPTVELQKNPNTCYPE